MANAECPDDTFKNCEKNNLAYCKCKSNVGMSIKSQNNQTNATTK